jgi:cell division protein FtsN
VLTLLIVVPLKTDLFKAKVETTTLNPLMAAELEDNKKVVDAEITNESVKPEEKIVPLVSVPLRPETVARVKTETDVYCLITGSFKSEENADSQVNILKEEGFSPEIIVAPNGFYRVSAMRSNDLTAASVKKDSISKKYPGAWILRKK